MELGIRLASIIELICAKNKKLLAGIELIHRNYKVILLPFPLKNYLYLHLSFVFFLHCLLDVANGMSLHRPSLGNHAKLLGSDYQSSCTAFVVSVADAFGRNDVPKMEPSVAPGKMDAFGQNDMPKMVPLVAN